MPWKEGNRMGFNKPNELAGKHRITDGNKNQLEKSQYPEIKSEKQDVHLSMPA